MPSSTSNSERRAAWPAGLLIGVALFGLCEKVVWSREDVLSLAARYTPPGPDGDPLLSAAALERLAQDRRGGVPILLMGSSQVREGLDCEAIERGLPGRTCANLAISAGAPLDMLYLERRFDQRLPRRTVVLGIFPKILHGPPKKGFVDSSTVACLLQPDTWRGVGRATWMDVVYGLLQGLSPTLRYKASLWAADDVVGGRWAEAWRLRLPPQPERLLAHTTRKPERYFEQRRGRLEPDFWALGPFSAAQERALGLFLDRESARGHRTLVVDFPTCPGYETTLPEDARAHYSSLIERLRQRADILFVPRTELPPLDANDFLDFTHLGPRGRAVVSARIAELIAGAEQGPAPGRPRD